MKINLQNKISGFIKKDSRSWKLFEIILGFRYFFIYQIYYRQKSCSIKEIFIEFVSYCNLRCPLCSLDHSKTKERITKEVLIKIFDNLYYDRRFRNVKIIHLHNAGEALLHPEFNELLIIIAENKEKFKRAGYKFPKISLLTNGTTLRPHASDVIINSKVIDYLRISMDGGTPEEFEKMRKGAKWKLFSNNVNYFIEKNQSIIKTSFITLILPQNKQNTRWMHPSFKQLYDLVDSYEIRYPHNWRGETKLAVSSPVLTKKGKFGCQMLVNQLVILPSGNVTICCNDLNSVGKLGSILNDSLYDLYNSKKRLNMISLFYNRKKKEIDLCKDCPTF